VNITTIGRSPVGLLAVVAFLSVAAYTLQGFHDGFVEQGGLPLELMRQVLLPGDSSPTL
jgi:hypothetical protein